MANRSNSSRNRILQSAEKLILDQGFSATSIEEIIQHASITKGGFFYHFHDRGELAQALVERFIEENRQQFGELFAQADRLSEDPLHQLLIFLNLLADMMGELRETHPGCLVATFTYESRQFDANVHRLVRESMEDWRLMMRRRLDQVVGIYPSRIDLDLEALSDMFTSAIEGGIILSRVFSDNRYLIQQIQAYRNHLRLLFDAV